MTYYLLPKSSPLIYKYITCIEQESPPTPVISNSLSEYLYETKKKLDEREKDWDVFKKYTNPYEYIHTPIPFKKKCISKYKPLSRSYFKMIEMVNTFNLYYDNPIHSFHLAEGPGGFIEAMAGLRKCQNDTYIGMTIIDDNQDPNIPGWKKTESFLRQNKNVYIETASDKTGNILSLENLVYCKDKYASSMELITGDGGFDFSMDFNNQEIHIAKLLFGQIAYAVTMQKKGGSFILKIFDSFMQHTIDLLYILSSFYEKVYIIKPNTSRYANSERYIVCKDFIFSSCEKFYPFIYKAFEKMLLVNEYIYRFLNIPISYFFISKLEEYNAIIGQQQIEIIHYTISLIENKHKQEKIDNLIRVNIQKCVQWCVKHNIPCNTITNNTNIFTNQTFLELIEDNDII
uniref:Ribosomal RNA methyltransferase FtsJ domain-containing protein n=1 Tax=viral metagenome TaxID=1070528 RepID=A0A6C0DDS2_9ZZZZ